MKQQFLALVLGLALTFFSTQALTAQAADAGGGRFGATSVWHPTPEILTALHAACDKLQGDARGACAAQQMQKAGATAHAMRFTRALFAQKGTVGILTAFREYGSVGLGWVVYPFGDDRKQGLLFVNSDPNFLDPNDLSKLDRSALEQNATFQDWKKASPDITLWPTDFPAAERQVELARIFEGEKPGEKRFFFSYHVAAGCATCGGSRFANYLWSFDGNGKFQGARLQSVTRALPPMKRPPSNSSAAAQPTPQPSGAPPPSATADH